MKRTIKSTQGRGGDLMECLEGRRMFSAVVATTTTTHEMAQFNQPAHLANAVTAPVSAMDDPSVYFKPRPNVPELEATATITGAAVAQAAL